MNTGRRKKVIGGWIFMLVATFVVTQAAWAATFSGTDLVIPEGYTQWSKTDKLAYLNKLNQDGDLSNEALEVLVLTVDDEDSRTRSTVRLEGRIIRNVFTVTKQIVDFITDNFINNRRTVGTQVTTFNVGTTGRITGASSSGSSTEVSADGKVGENEVDPTQASEVTRSTTKSAFSVFFGEVVLTKSESTSLTRDILNMVESTSKQIIDYFTNASGTYTHGEGKVTATSNNLNYKVVNGEVDRTQIVKGSQITSRTEGKLEFTKLSGVGSLVLTGSESITIQTNTMTKEVTASANDTSYEYRGDGTLVRDADGKIQASSRTYSLQGWTDEGARFNMADLTAAGEGELLKGTELLKALARTPVNPDGTGGDMPDGSVQDPLAKALMGNGIQAYSVASSRVDFGSELSRSNELLAFQNITDTRSRDITELGKSRVTQSDGRTTITINYVAGRGGLTSRIASQTGIGSDREVKFNIDPVTGKQVAGVDPISDERRETSITFMIDSVNNQAIVSQTTTSVGKRTYAGIGDSGNTQDLSVQTTNFTYSGNRLTGAETVIRSESMKLVERTRADGTIYLVGDPTGTAAGSSHSVGLTVISYIIEGNQALADTTRSVTITDSFPVEGQGQAERQVSYSSIKNIYAKGVAAGQVIDFSTASPQGTQVAWHLELPPIGTQDDADTRLRIEFIGTLGKAAGALGQGFGNIPLPATFPKIPSETTWWRP